MSTPTYQIDSHYVLRSQPLAVWGWGRDWEYGVGVGVETVSLRISITILALLCQRSNTSRKPVWNPWQFCTGSFPELLPPFPPNQGGQKGPNPRPPATWVSLGAKYVGFPSNYCLWQRVMGQLTIGMSTNNYPELSLHSCAPRPTPQQCAVWSCSIV